MDNAACTLAKTAVINNVNIDCFYNDGEVWFTRSQIGEALEYADPQSSVLMIHRRHKERLDPLSCETQFDTLSGIQKGYVYNLRGVIEICRWSRQPKADTVLDAFIELAQSVKLEKRMTEIDAECLYKLLKLKLSADGNADGLSPLMALIRNKDGDCDLKKLNIGGEENATMDATKLKALLDKELENNPSIYDEAILPALVESKLKRFDIVGKFLCAAEVEVSKVQMGRLSQRDFDREKAIADAKRQEKERQDKIDKKLAKWKEENEKLYTFDDFPEWVIEQIANTREKAEQEVNSEIEKTINMPKSEFSKNFREMPEEYLIIDGKALFTRAGFKFMIMRSKINGWTNQEGLDKWLKESGLFPEYDEKK